MLFNQHGPYVIHLLALNHPKKSLLNLQKGTLIKYQVPRTKDLKFQNFLVAHCPGLCGEREMSEFLRIRGGQRQGGCRIYFTSIPLFGPCAPRLLKAFLLVLSNSTSFQCVNQKGLEILERNNISSLNLLYRLLAQQRRSIILRSSFFAIMRTPHPSHVFINININISCF